VQVEKLIKLMLIQFHVSDAGVGMTDYALQSSGAFIIEKRTSPSYVPPPIPSGSTSVGGESATVFSVPSWARRAFNVLLLGAGAAANTKKTFIGQASPAALLQVSSTMPTIC
jgi:hypothetical protein